MRPLASPFDAVVLSESEQLQFSLGPNFYLAGLLIFVLLLFAGFLVWLILYRLEIGFGDCFVGVGGDSNFGIVSIRNFGPGVGGLTSANSPAA